MCRRWLNNLESTFPLEIFGDSGLEKNLQEFSTVHDVLRNEVNVPIAVVAELLIWLFLLSEDLPEVSEVDGGALSSIEGVSVDVEHLLS